MRLLRRRGGQRAGWVAEGTAPGGRFAHSRVTIHEAVAGGLAADVEVLREAMGDPLSWRQEFECEFVDEATAFLTHELITRCVDRSLSKAVDWERLGDRSARIYFGADVARRGDWAVIWLWEAVGDLYVTRGVIEMRDTSSGGIKLPGTCAMK